MSTNPASAIADEGPTYASTAGASLAFAKLDEDYLLRLTPFYRGLLSDIDMATNPRLFEPHEGYDLRFTVAAPLSFVLADRGSDDADGVFRTRDWDEPAEYVRILRSVEFGTPYGGVYARGGDLANVRAGHRTIVDNYINTLDIDHFQWGIHSNLNTKRGGYELVVDNVVDPELLGARGYVRPAGFGANQDAWDRFALGASIFADISAPSALRIDEEGRYVTDDVNGLIVEESDATALVGFDIEAQVVTQPKWSLTPYFDANLHLERGLGLHAGTFVGWDVDETVTLDFRAEYRFIGEDYLPSYFGPLYEVERFAYLPVADSTQRLPKLRWLRSDLQAQTHGYLGEFGVRVDDRFSVSTAYSGAGTPDSSSFWIRAAFTGYDPVDAAVYLLRNAFDDFGDIFDFDDALLVAEARVQVNDWLYTFGQASRMWNVDRDGAYRAVDNFALGVGGELSFERAE